ncbi:Clp protease N-terminal domain-containing protein [Amycolatopsis sp. OK19-0408]|uniref:Clp protease N-terminal domain-containing protein n=1 Tax=Amycolatopsis iheyensis TaxID=2945988 RepID=A0A9X2SJV2_9PSEU|nr:Clp protease N-terminal domain-containing protein [Amycolatopsis iheyensis]MCR6484809.1 Clp protease N-terminal domain-containing protein [Amycolatopsis iheyensis]
MLDRLIAKSPFAVVVTAALAESRRRGDRRLGTEHLLLGLLHDPDCARALGVDLEQARAALDRLDRAALAALGIEVEGMRPPRVPVKRGKLTLGALTSNARAVVNEALRERVPAELLRVLLTVTPPDPAADLLAELGVDREAVRRRVNSPAGP